METKSQFSGIRDRTRLLLYVVFLLLFVPYCVWTVVRNLSKADRAHYIIEYESALQEFPSRKIMTLPEKPIHTGGLRISRSIQCGGRFYVAMDNAYLAEIERSNFSLVGVQPIPKDTLPLCLSGERHLLYLDDHALKIRPIKGDRFGGELIASGIISLEAVISPADVPAFAVQCSVQSETPSWPKSLLFHTGQSVTLDRVYDGTVQSLTSDTLTLFDSRSGFATTYRRGTDEVVWKHRCEALLSTNQTGWFVISEPGSSFGSLELYDASREVPRLAVHWKNDSSGVPHGAFCITAHGRKVGALYQRLEIWPKSEHLYYYLLIVDIETGDSETVPISVSGNRLPKGLLPWD